MPVAPPSRCGAMRCSEFATKRGRCDEHQPQPWAARTPPRERYGMSSGTMRALKRRVMARDNGCCYICGDEGAEELEHKVPISQGGASRDLDNLGVVHAGCHAAKSRQEAIDGARRARSSRG